LGAKALFELPSVCQDVEDSGVKARVAARQGANTLPCVTEHVHELILAFLIKVRFLAEQPSDPVRGHVKLWGLQASSPCSGSMSIDLKLA